MPFWCGEQPLVLASRSETRRRILVDAGIPVEVHPSDVDERSIEQRAAADGAQLAALLALEKARTVAARLPGRLVLGADQTLTLDERIFSKAMTVAAARRQLEALRGCTHQLSSAAALVLDGRILFESRDLARLSMRAFSDDFLDAYLDAMAGRVMESVGAYQLESLGIQLFERIEGDYFVILGMPLLDVLRFLRGEGLLAA